ncbi:NADPH-dependent oxidoreductase [Aerococcus kribbianus]|uniref:NADPH-dependent oxidoreductase n=1 Tax=Aerococcus kribbianus TaxID=2999064 RepID=A0A9X3FMA0_9LACT|nr:MULTISPECIES: NADPH-dependent oxidoreductase [unclassified Aerococcus]MCZ0717147.1 NADPH-dependent oxidoreductase [Aerococcus sp. YH-aer221]MCZ0725435.1 NADPH-dependent oxidoreductase [Aerococcus sp. YH-aer222]
MKLIGIVGSLDEVTSYNEKLLYFIKDHFASQFNLEVLSIADFPLFDPHVDFTESDLMKTHLRKLNGADGVIISTGEHSRTIPPVLKSYLEWMSYQAHPFANKPVMVMGASYLDQGTSSSQLHLRQVLEAPGVGAYTFPGNEFLLGEAQTAFDQDGQLKDEGTIKVLGDYLNKFTKFVQIFNQVESGDPRDEDLWASGTIETTIDVEKSSDNWVEEAATKVNAASGDDYVRLDHGVMTVNQISEFLKSMPQELTFADENNQFLYYNYNTPTDNMLAKRKPSQVGNPLGACHPERAHDNVKKVIHLLRSGQTECFRLHVPTHGPDKFVVHSYQRIVDEDGNYRGVNEYVQDIQPMIDWYLEKTGQELVGGNVDGASGASAAQSDQTATTLAAPNATDADTGASASNQTEESNTDADSGASQH